MNANVTVSAVDSRAPVAAPHPTHKFGLLLKREFWEHKGGFFWTPLVAGAVFLLLTLMGIGVGEMALNRAGPQAQVQVGGAHVQIVGLDLGMLTSKMTPADMDNLSGGVDMSLFMASSWPFIALGFVVFFYCLGCLYDERKDRSVLFWKSLPLSDRDTVLSKLASATLVAPALAIIAAIGTMFGFLALLSLLVVLHGGNAVQLLWAPGSPLGVAGFWIASLPVYAMWALPTVGWLMLCSSWAKSKPFLWAIMIPLFAGIFVSWFDLMHLFNLESGWFWKNVVARALTSTFPGTWFGTYNLDHVDTHGPEAMLKLMDLRLMYSTFASPAMWAGALAGAAMILGAIRLRRYRDEG